MASGRIRKEVTNGWNPLVEGIFDNVDLGTLNLGPGESHELRTEDFEYGCVLIQGDCEVAVGSEGPRPFGPRPNPFEHKPYGLLLTREQTAEFTAKTESVIAVGISPAEKSYPNLYLTPDDIREYDRGSDNWSRSVRFVIWADNSEGNQLIMGETIVPSGNWGTVPPHRHDTYIPDEEVPYNEIYYYRFSKPQGFGLIWQFDDEGEMDQAFSLKTGDAAYMGEGYHPLTCGPGSTLYQLTAMAGPHRISRSRIHDDYVYITEEKDMVNPYKNQK